VQTNSFLTELNNFVNEDLAEVNDLIKNLTKGREELIFLLSTYLVSSGGKRLRPILTLLCAKLCGYQGKHHIALATAVEFIHTATLLHDDVVDESSLRRGMLTANNKWGNKASILVGDFLLGQAFKLMVDAGSLKVLDILSQASITIAEGEVMQLASTNNINITREQYLEVIQAKTAELFAASCQIGGVLVENLEQETALRSFGMNLGIAFQILDDMLDYSAKEEELGKTVGDDFREGKVTLPVIIAYANGTKQEQNFWSKTIQDLKQQPEDLVLAIDLINQYDAINLSRDIAKQYLQKAREAVIIFKESPAKHLLLDLLIFSLERSY
jgi:octaprenyl-diphosphate synthase